MDGQAELGWPASVSKTSSFASDKENEEKAICAMLVLPFLLMLSTTPSTPPAVFIQQEIVTTPSSNTENYLPRRLYPGTYKNYCGPTPEITVRGGCTAHGWHGDEALDQVDEACRLHDISYCSCESQLLPRKNNANGDQQIKGLSSIVALRFATLPALYQTHTVDKEYLDCIHKADTELIATGIKVRGQQQRSNCDQSLGDPSLGWFCKEGGTLAAFEKVNLNIFLRDLDADESSINPHPRMTLSQLERKRRNDLMREVKSGKTIGDASSSKIVEEDEEQMLQLLEGFKLSKMPTTR
jgi:hypothetical protein